MPLPGPTKLDDNKPGAEGGSLAKDNSGAVVAAVAGGLVLLALVGVVATSGPKRRRR